MRENRSRGGAADRKDIRPVPEKPVKGLLKADELARLVGTGEIETVVVAFTDHYGRLLGKRYDAEMFVEEVASHGAHACDYLLTVDMEMDPVPGYRFANWALGYGDFHLVPDMSCLLYTSDAADERSSVD